MDVFHQSQVCWLCGPLLLLVEFLSGINRGFKYNVPTCTVKTIAKNIFPALILDAQGDVIFV